MILITHPFRKLREERGQPAVLELLSETDLLRISPTDSMSYFTTHYLLPTSTNKRSSKFLDSLPQV